MSETSDESSITKMADTAWVGSVSALGGVALTSLFNLITSRSDRAANRENRREEQVAAETIALRDARRAAYVRYLTHRTSHYNAVCATDGRAIAALPTLPEKNRAIRESVAPEIYDALTEAEAEVQLLASEAVRDLLIATSKQAETSAAAISINMTPDKLLDDIQAPLIRAMKHDLFPDV